MTDDERVVDIEDVLAIAARKAAGELTAEQARAELERLATDDAEGPTP